MQRFAILLMAALAIPAFGADWLRFRGPNGSGVSDSTGLPAEFGPNKNVVWKTDIPPGHSSPVLTRDQIFLTALENQRLFTLSLNRADGKILWRREAPRNRVSETNRLNNAASPTPVSDGRNVYVFFADFGILSYGPDGNERWRLALGPFDNQMGMAASPILADGKLILVCDQDSGSFMIAVDPQSGAVLWRVDRAEYTRGFSTPIVYRHGDGPTELIIPGAYQVASYSVENGEKLWWARGIAFEVKSMAVVDGDMLYVHGWSSTGDAPNDPLPEFADALAQHDADKDARFSPSEAFLPMMRDRFSYFDFDRDGFIDEGDWSNTQTRLSAQNALLAVRLGGRGDLTDAIAWKYRRNLPNVPSPLLYHDVLYLVKDGGIFTTLDPKTGAVFKQGRLRDAIGPYWACPIAADGKIYVANQEGKLSVLTASGEWEVLATNELGEEVFATPAVADGRIYVRTHSALYAFGK